MRQLRILNLEDSSADAELIHSLLEQDGFDCSITRVDTRESFERALKKGIFDLILSDYNLPAFDGINALKLVTDLGVQSPFIFVSGTIGEERAIEALKLGATDYVIKDRMERLVPAVRRAIREHQERSEKESLQLQLERSQRLETVGTLAGGIAHDFNNVLAIILGYTSQLIGNKNNPAEVEKSAAAIKNAIARGASFTRQLLNFARRNETLPEPVSINTAIAEHVSMLEQTFPRSIVIATELGPDLPEIDIVPAHFQQVLLNLCVNARDAIESGGKIVIRTYALSGDDVRKKLEGIALDKYVCLEIVDTGCGMTEEIKLRIFEPFYTTKGEGKGTGLGLSVVFGIMDRVGGHILVDSAPGQGARFQLFFPSLDRHELTVPEKTEITKVVRGGTETLMVVDDEAMLRNLAEALLSAEGYNVVMAADGAEAVAIYREKAAEIDLVICDYNLPQINGQMVFEKMRELNPQLKFIFSTGFADEVVAATRKAGVLAIIEKPYTQDDLLFQIRLVLDKDRVFKT